MAPLEARGASFRLMARREHFSLVRPALSCAPGVREGRAPAGVSLGDGPSFGAYPPGGVTALRRVPLSNPRRDAPLACAPGCDRCLMARHGPPTAVRCSA